MLKSLLILHLKHVIVHHFVDIAQANYEEYTADPGQICNRNETNGVW